MRDAKNTVTLVLTLDGPGNQEVEVLMTYGIRHLRENVTDPLTGAHDIGGSEPRRCGLPKSFHVDSLCP